MNKSGLLAIAGALLITSVAAYSSPRTGGDNPGYVNTHTGVTNDVVVDWKDTTKGGDAYNGPGYTGETTVYYVQPEYQYGDNQAN